MPDGLIEAAAGLFGPSDDRVHGVAVALVLDNVDPMNEARVKLQLPWLPGFEPWARVAAVVAGSRRGFYWLPQVDDEVLVAFEQGDVREPYVLGGLWNGRDLPPSNAGADARSKLIMKTQGGHVIELDDLAKSVKVTTIGNQKLTLDDTSIKLEAGQSKATFETSGKIAIEGATEISIKAQSIKLDGTTVDITGSGSVKLDGGGACTIKGAVVRIN